jgi:hypothetical protein
MSSKDGYVVLGIVVVIAIVLASLIGSVLIPVTIQSLDLGEKAIVLIVMANPFFFFGVMLLICLGFLLGVIVFMLLFKR